MHNEFAFPLALPEYVAAGLTKREYIAALAMQAIISTQTTETIKANMWLTTDQIAESAANHADALIEYLKHNPA